jgi:hypothetical protein
VDILGFVLTAVLAVSGAGQVGPESIPPVVEEVDSAEVVRQGNMVQKISRVRDWRSDGIDAAVEAMGPPADEEDRWFISIIGMKGCAPCNHLASDWKTDPHLLALANPDDNSTSWANYNHYDSADASQARRWAGLKIGGYPTIVVQPPLSGKYGPPSTVVLQVEGYDGNGKALALKITNGIKRYAAKVAEGSHDGPIRQGQGQGQSETNLIGIEPPFIPPPKNPLPPTLPGVIVPSVIVPPEVVQKPNAVSSAFSFWQFVIGILIGCLIVFGIGMWRDYRIEALAAAEEKKNADFNATVNAAVAAAIKKSTEF